MKSLSLDCAETTPPVSGGMRSQFIKSKPIRHAHGFATSGETSDWERSVSPSAPSPRRLPMQPSVGYQMNHIQPTAAVVIPPLCNSQIAAIQAGKIICKN
jgi:hypothetical protein